VSVRHFNLPDLGEGLTDAELVRWLVAVGDVIDVDQPVAEVVTAKASVELPSPFGGVVVTLHYAVGDVVEVGAPLLSVGDAGDGADVSSVAGAPNGAQSGSGNVLVGYGTRPEGRRRRKRPSAAESFEPIDLTPAPSEPVGLELATDDRTATAGQDRPGPAVLSPVVRRLARDLGVDLTTVAGSGPQGVITRGDVELAAGTTDIERSAGARHSPRPPAGTRDEVERIPLRGLHRQMAQRLARSRREIPEATVWVDADATGLLDAKRAIDETHPDRTAGVGITSWLARFCVLGLQQWPLLNSALDGDEIVVSRQVNLGFAAQTERGLVVPVVHDADQLDLLELDTEIRRLTQAAREAKLTTGDVTGGSFTLNNYGVFGVDGSAAIINFPEVAIVGVGRIMARPWVVDGDIRARPVTELTLAFDHRVCDGGVAGGFLRFVADCVELPARLLSL
jgi:2-oxoisovalerate dehydrogenase E2 component (dihydrolipoyl transacylase)